VYKKATYFVVENRARRETEKLCSNNEVGERDGKAERQNLKN
jgi:hypothetical protein